MSVNQVVTKRAERMREIVSALPLWFGATAQWSHIWHIVSMECQSAADERADILRRTPNTIRGISIEPMLEEVVIPHIEKFDWVIVGGESGPRARPFDWDWARSVRDQCRAYEIPFFMKQGGGYPNKRDKLVDIPKDLRIREYPKGLLASPLFN